MVVNSHPLYQLSYRGPVPPARKFWGGREFWRPKPRFHGGKYRGARRVISKRIEAGKFFADNLDVTPGALTVRESPGSVAQC
jgi:hypothetical protein